MISILTKSKKLRFLSHLNSVFLLPPKSYERSEKDVSIQHDHCFETNEKNPNLFHFEKKVVLDFIKANFQNEKCFIGLCHFYRNEGKPNDIKKLIEEIAEKDKNTNRKNTINCLLKMFTLLKLRERFIFLTQCFVFYVYSDRINWNAEIPKLEKIDPGFWYEKNRKNGKMEMDEYVFDRHTRNGNKSILYFVDVSAKVENEDNEFLIPEFKKMYRLSKIPIKSIKGIPVLEIDSKAEKEITSGKRAQLKTSKYKKSVFVFEKNVYKGPYDKKEKSFTLNIENPQKLKKLEENIEPKYRSNLDWKYILHIKGRYYFVMKNVGKFENIKSQMKTSSIEENVEIIDRNSFVNRVSEIDLDPNVSKDTLLATLQHLYFRYILNIGDSGPHNILVRNDDSERLIVGLDMEEERKKCESKCVFDLLFKVCSKDRKKVYSQFIRLIKLVDSNSERIKNINNAVQNYTF